MSPKHKKFLKNEEGPPNKVDSCFKERLLVSHVVVTRETLWESGEDSACGSWEHWV